jgi:hypothetical protein
MGARPKFDYLRSQAYLRYVATQACFACGIEGQSNACHSNQAKHGKGRSIKASDAFTWPLCIRHHREHDQCLEMTKAERDALEDAYIERMLELALFDGWLDGRRLGAMK